MQIVAAAGSLPAIWRTMMAKLKKTGLMIGFNANLHHNIWCSSDINEWGETLF